jgi:shikimate dehydrogenase
MDNMNEITDISGTTRLYAILADPIHHVQTPQLMNALFRQRGADRLMVALHVPGEQLAAAVAGLRHLANLEGFIVTVPHKTAMLALCDEVTVQARQVGAVNVVRRGQGGQLQGDILDGTGFVAGLRREGIEPRGCSVYLAGAGGAANAIAFALAEAGVARLTIANRSQDKADALRQRLSAVYPQLPVSLGGPDPSGHRLVVNATSLGLASSDPLPCDASRLTPDQIVAEIIMQPPRTALLLAAEARGCRLHGGLPMLSCQIELMAAGMGVPSSEAQP